MIDEEETPYWNEEFNGYSITFQRTQKGRWHAFYYPEGQEHGTASHVSARTMEEVSALARGGIQLLVAKDKRQ